MKILTADEMRAVDRVTSEHYGIASYRLMENAGNAVARFVLREFPDLRRITVLCGKGNNGGDGFIALVLSRKLAVPSRFFCWVTRKTLKVMPNLLSTRWLYLQYSYLKNQLSMQATFKICLKILICFLTLLFGTGFKPPLHGVAAILCDRIMRKSNL